MKKQMDDKQLIKNLAKAVDQMFTKDQVREKVKEAVKLARELPNYTTPHYYASGKYSEQEILEKLKL